MKLTLKRTLLLVALLSPLTACSSLSAPASSAANPVLTTQATKILPNVAVYGRVLWCFNINDPRCLKLNVLQARIGGSMTPTGDFQMLFNGEKELLNVFKQSFSLTFPSSGFTKFDINGVTLTLDSDLDKNLVNRTSECTLNSSEVDQKGIYTHLYTCQ